MVAPLCASYEALPLNIYAKLRQSLVELVHWRHTAQSWLAGSPSSAGLADLANPLLNAAHAAYLTDGLMGRGRSVGTKRLCKRGRHKTRDR